jgi:hypothetical protein
MIDDKDLLDVSKEIDDMLFGISTTYKMDPLSVSAITLARLIHLNNIVDGQDDLAKLLLSIGDSIVNRELELDKPKNVH